MLGIVPDALKSYLLFHLDPMRYFYNSTLTPCGIKS
jgi:hypothetical protein